MQSVLFDDYEEHGRTSDDYEEATREDLTLVAISSAWPPQAFAQVALQGVTLDDVRDAFLQNPSLPKVSLRRVSALGQSVATISRRLPVCRGHLATSAWVGVSLTVEGSISIGLVLKVVVVGNCMV